MNKINLFSIVALLLAFQFCGLSGYTYVCDTIVLECESDTDEESKENKKEHKLSTVHLTYYSFQTSTKEETSILNQTTWIPPHLEIGSQPPELN